MPPWYTIEVAPLRPACLHVHRSRPVDHPHYHDNHFVVDIKTLPIKNLPILIVDSHDYSYQNLPKKMLREGRAQIIHHSGVFFPKVLTESE